MNDDFERVFGVQPDRPITFTERLGRPDGRPRETAQAESAPDESGIYKPFGFMPAGQAIESCDIRRWVDGTDVPEGLEFPYRLLIQVSYIGDEQLRLLLPNCIVVIAGVGLTALRQKLSRRQVTFVQQFNPRIWSSCSSLEILINSIEVLRAEG